MLNENILDIFESEFDERDISYEQNNYKNNNNNIVKKIIYDFKKNELCNSSIDLIDSFERYLCGFKKESELVKECKSYISLLERMKKN